MEGSAGATERRGSKTTPPFIHSTPLLPVAAARARRRLLDAVRLVVAVVVDVVHARGRLDDDDLGAVADHRGDACRRAAERGTDVVVLAAA